MVEYLARYKQLIASAADVYSKLIELYTAGAPADPDAARNAGEAGVYRKGLLEDIALPRKALTIEDTSPFIVSTKHYLDSHWADFTTYPVPSPDNKEYPASDPEKRQRLLALHAELEGIIKAVAQLDVALR